MKNLFGSLSRLLPLLIILVGVGGFMAMGGRPPVEPEQDKDAALPLVQVVATELHQKGLDFEVDGVAVPYRELLLTAKVSGAIENKAENCKAGRFVKKGTVLMEIDPQDYQFEVDRLKMELGQAEVNLKELDVEIANTHDLLKLASDEVELRQREVARVARLVGRSVGSDSEIDTARRNEIQSRNSELSLRNQARLLQARRERLEHAQSLVQTKLKKAELDLKRTKIVAPTDGVIVMDHVESGTYVQPGTTLVTLEDTSAVEVRCNLRMEELNWLWRQHDPLQVNAVPNTVQQDYQFPTTDVTIVYALEGREFTWQGELSRFDGVGLDERTRTVPCRVLVDQPRQVRLSGSEGLTSASPSVAGPPALVRGMFVTVHVHAHPHAKLLRLPEKAIRPGNEVWVVRDGKLDRCQIHVARVTDEGVLIDANRSDLEVGDQVVTTPMTATPKADGLGFAEEGMPVRVQEQAKLQL